MTDMLNVTLGPVYRVRRRGDSGKVSGERWQGGDGMGDHTSGDGDWLDCCAAFADAEGVPTDRLAILRAFASPWPRGGPEAPAEAPWSDGFDRLEAQLMAQNPWETIQTSLTREVDSAQAAMMARRTAAVDGLLASLEDPEARLLRVGLRHRVQTILEAPGPRVLRIRALADFYYSHTGRLVHRLSSDAPPSLESCVGRIRWETTAPGIEWGRIQGTSTLGPLHINVLRVSPSQVRLRVMDCRPMITRGESLEDHLRRERTAAAISGGFFLYSESPIRPPSARYDPVGLLLCGGDVVSPPVFRRGSLLVSDAGEVAIRAVSLTDTPIRLPSGRILRPDRVLNGARPSPSDDPHAVAIVGHEVTAVGASVTPPLNGYVIHVPPEEALQVGAPIGYEPPSLRPGGPQASEGLSGGPLLVQGGHVSVDLRAEDFWGDAPPVTFSQDETGDENLLPRLAAGLHEDGRLILAAIDGRDLKRALGLTLRDTGHLMRALDCRVATNLDGGSSKRMLVAGRTVDLASTEVHGGARAHRSGDPSRTRPIHSALLINAGR